MVSWVSPCFNFMTTPEEQRAYRKGYFYGLNEIEKEIKRLERKERIRVMFFIIYIIITPFIMSLLLRIL